MESNLFEIYFFISHLSVVEWVSLIFHFPNDFIKVRVTKHFCFVIDKK